MIKLSLLFKTAIKRCVTEMAEETESWVSIDKDKIIFGSENLMHKISCVSSDVSLKTKQSLVIFYGTESTLLVIYLTFEWLKTSTKSKACYRIESC